MRGGPGQEAQHKQMGFQKETEKRKSSQKPPRDEGCEAEKAHADSHTKRWGRGGALELSLGERQRESRHTRRIGNQNGFELPGSTGVRRQRSHPFEVQNENGFQLTDPARVRVKKDTVRDVPPDVDLLHVPSQEAAGGVRHQNEGVSQERGPGHREPGNRLERAEDDGGGRSGRM